MFLNTIFSEDCSIRLEYWIAVELELLCGEPISVSFPVLVTRSRGGKIAGSALPPHTDHLLYFASGLPSPLQIT